ncbi:MAG: SDR family oxidoreductase [Rhizobium sp.]|nr:SDR family oxidoreductase [Rhizobium sp.]
MDQRPSIIVTGASSGIGAHAARALKAEGWRVFATVRRDQDRAPLESDGIETFLMDYTDTPSIHALIEAVLERTDGRLDALYNNGAYGQPGAVEDLPTDVLRLQFETNFFGWHELTRRVIPVMRAQGRGRIVNCSSILGLVPYKWRGAYNASKYALEGLTVTMMMELKGSGIHVSLIEPGPIASNFMANALKAVEANIDIENTAHRQEYQRQLKRLRGELSGARGKLGPEAVYEVLRHALTSPSPKPHYIVTKPAKRGVLLKRLLPSGLFYRILGSLG